MGKWSIVPANRQAADEAALLFKDQDIKRQCNTMLKLLSQEDDPTKPTNPTLNTQAVSVGRIKHDAPSWYKFRIQWDRKTENSETVKIRIRILFSLGYVEGEHLVEYQYCEQPLDNADNCIVIEQIGHRTDNTYIEARRRWRKAHGK